MEKLALIYAACIGVASYVVIAKSIRWALQPKSQMPVSETGNNSTVNVQLCDGSVTQAKRLITGNDGKQYVFNRPVNRLYGDLCLDDLSQSEIVIAPGLIYQSISK